MSASAKEADRHPRITGLQFTDNSSTWPSGPRKLSVPDDACPAVPLNKTNCVVHPPESAICGKKRSAEVEVSASLDGGVVVSRKSSRSLVLPWRCARTIPRPTITTHFFCLQTARPKGPRNTSSWPTRWRHWTSSRHSRHAEMVKSADHKCRLQPT